AEHDVVVDLLRQPFPQLEGLLVQKGSFVPKVVGANDGGVAPGIAAAKPALLQHGDAAHAVLAGEVVGGGQAVTTAADDDHVVLARRLGAAPGALPVLVEAERVARQAEYGVPAHRQPVVARPRRVPTVTASAAVHGMARAQRRS